MKIGEIQFIRSPGLSDVWVLARYPHYLFLSPFSDWQGRWCPMTFIRGPTSHQDMLRHIKKNNNNEIKKIEGLQLPWQRQSHSVKWKNLEYACGMWSNHTSKPGEYTGESEWEWVCIWGWFYFRHKHRKHTLLDVKGMMDIRNGHTHKPNHHMLMTFQHIFKRHF